MPSHVYNFCPKESKTDEDTMIDWEGKTNLLWKISSKWASNQS